ncbi:MAG: M20/M25/M40 family metallo-hydrolase [Spirochaetaceae bacterium]|jgi:amidohydrolase|nr:M20/M25/M40 family metallo-hydrolase [Spirochaetaceae bacterium]
MTDKDNIKRDICACIDGAAEKIQGYAGSVWSEPELGFKETKTAAKTAAFFRGLGLPTEEGLALTGVRARLAGNAGPTVAIFGELDAIGCPEAPSANPETGAAHVCGHFLQLGAMMGAAIALSELYRKEKLDGNVVFFAVPAEEYVEIAYRTRLREEGKIFFLSGKGELIYRGELAGIDMAMMIHSNAYSPEPSVYIGKSSNGFIGKTIRYIGKEAHAAAAPHEGVNALNAAMLGLAGIHALRETFRDEDHIRVHPVITKGGDLVNSVPADVRLETYVRGKTMEAIEATHGKVDRALRAGGDAVGAKTVINTSPGMLPLVCPEELNDIFIQNAEFAHPGIKVARIEHFSGSTDMGDVSHLMPAIHPYIGGVTGALHGRDFAVTDFAAACLLPAKALALSVVDLLADGAGAAKKIIADHKPLLTADEYVAKMSLYFKEER